MTTEEKSKKRDWDDESDKFLVQAQHKGYKKLLTGKGDQVGVSKIPTQNEYDLAVAGNSMPDIFIVTVGQLNELAYEDIML